MKLDRPMRLLVTGGAGYVGAHTCIVLLQAGHDIVVVDNFSNSDATVLQTVMEIGGRRLCSIEADIRDRKAMKSVLSEGKFDGILHFAALKSAPESLEQPELYWDVNVGGTAILLEAALAAGVRKFVFSSSAIVYGTQEIVPTPETAPLRPINPYAWSKLVGEQMLDDVGRSRVNFHACSLRYFNPIGNHSSGRIGENPKQRATNIFPVILSACRDRKPVNIYGTDYDTRDGSAVRDFIHVMDVAEGHSAALKFLVTKEAGAGSDAAIFNLGTGQGSSVRDLVHAMERAAGTTIECRESGRRAGDIAISVANPERSATILGWRARRSLDQACSDAMRWLDDGSARSM